MSQVFEVFTVIFGLLLFFGSPFLLWHLDKPERELRKQRLAAERDALAAVGYVFSHIAGDIVGFDRARAMFEDYCRTGAILNEQISHDMEVEEGDGNDV